MQESDSWDARIFVRCGDRFAPPGPEWQVVDLPAALGPRDIPDAVVAVRQVVSGHKRVKLAIAGPNVLGVALGQGLEHIPTRVDYYQLNQQSKEYEYWLSNTLNL